MYHLRKYITLFLLLAPVVSLAAFSPTIPAEGEKSIIVDPRMHMWAAYDEDGKLVKTGMATLGNSFCRDTGRSCRTKVGTHRIESLGDAGCKSRKFPLPRGGAPMPYCMFFHNGQALHGSNAVVRANVSHGCVRLHVSDAKWLRFNFAEEPTKANEQIGTKVIILPY
jgi:lipoprotein-anchoring transpeptidase ErfK/SrfK